MAYEFDLYDITKSHVDKLTDQLYTSLPATVTKYNASKQSVDVSIDPSSGTISVTLDGVSPSMTTALASYSNASGVVTNAKITTVSSITTVASGSRGGFVVAGKFLVNSKPTWA